MADKREGSGRVTPKGTAPRGSGPKAGARGSAVPEAKGDPTGKPKVASGRYTPPIPQSVKVSPRWVPIAMGILLGLGFLVIVLNYIGAVPGGTSNIYLLVGLALITAGFIVATRWR